MKHILSKNIVVALAVLALVCVVATVIVLNTSPMDVAHAETAYQCGGDHADYVALTADSTVIGTDTTETYYYLAEDITSTAQSIEIASNATVTLCLNGHFLFGSGNDSVLKVGEGATLNICDCKYDSADSKHFYTVEDNGLWNFKDASGAYITSGDNYVCGGVISGGNLNSFGGGVYVADKGVVNFYSGNICGNKAFTGGGIYVGGNSLSSGTANIYGGRICGNYAKFVGGIFYYRNSSLFVSGACVIDENYGAFETAPAEIKLNNIQSNYEKVGFCVGKMEKGARVGFSIKNAMVGFSALNDYNTHNQGVNPNEYFHYDTNEFTLKIGGENAVLDQHTHESEVYAPLNSAGVLTTGKYALAKDLILNSADGATHNIVIADNAEVTICLNGYILSGDGLGSVITVGDGAVLNICDCRKDSVHYYTVDENGLWNFKDENGEFLTSGDTFINGGVITGGNNDVQNVSGGIVISNGPNNMATVNLTAGTIAGNVGGGVYNGGIFNMSGGAISGNTSSNSASGVHLYAESYARMAEFTMSAGKITDNYYLTQDGKASFGAVHNEFGSEMRVKETPVIENNFAKINGAIEKKDIVIDDMAYIKLAGRLETGAKLYVSANLGRKIVEECNLDGIVHIDDKEVSTYFKNDDEHLSSRLGFNGWSIIASNKHWLTLNKYKDGENYVVDESMVEYTYGESAITLPIPTYQCHAFEGWYEHEDFSGERVEFISAGAFGDKVYYAKWTENHAYGEWTVTTAPTCTEKGVETRVCSRDNTHTETREIETTEHTPTAYDEIPATCENEGRTGGTYCSVCDTQLTAPTVLPALGHNYGEWTVTTAPICTEKGVETRVCANDNTHKETREVAATGHKATAYDEIPATCENEGRTGGTYCSVCDTQLTAPTVLSALGHNYGEWTVTTAPTCTEKGVETRVCVNDNTHKETREVVATGHKATAYVEIPATCENEGRTGGTYCSVCDTQLTAPTVLSALGHNYGEWAVTTAPTCTEKGIETRVCVNDNTHTETREVNAIGHNFGEWKQTKKATIDVDGEEEHVCSVCGEKETRQVKYEGKSLKWVIIALLIVLLVESVILIVRVLSKKKKNKDDDNDSDVENDNDNKDNKTNKNVKTLAVLPILSATYLMSEIVACVFLGIADVALAVAIVCTFIKAKEKAVDKNEEVNSEEVATADSVEYAVVDAEADDNQVLASNGVGTLEDELSAEQLDEDVEEGGEEDGISLKESLALAVAHSQIKINKTSVAEWLSAHYGEEILLNRRVNKTKTGLPLADTHYVSVGAKKKCFVYVYELDGDKSMLLLKTDDETAKAIMDKYPMFVKSRFPKSQREHWYTLIPDSGFASADEVFDVIALVLSNYTDSLRQASKEVRDEIAKIEQVMKDNVSVQEAKELVSDEAASVLVTGRKHRKTGKKFAVNIDTLSDRYNEGDTVDINDLKEKGIVPKSAKQIKILARGMLNKPLIVVADDFSVDAIKMIVLTGGEALWS